MTADSKDAVQGEKPAAAGESAGPSGGARREIRSVELFAGRREVHIRHADDIYTLRWTSRGKLILTK